MLHWYIIIVQYILQKLYKNETLLKELPDNKDHVNYKTGAEIIDDWKLQF